METFYDDINIVLAKYVSGEASPEEAMAVNTWAQQSEENKKTLEQLEIAWGHRSLSEKDKAVLLKKIVQSPKQIKEKEFRIGFSYKWAASIVIVLLAGVSAYFILFKTETTVDPSRWIVKESKGKVLKHAFQDSSEVVLSQNSSIRYPEKFDSHIRQLELTGEGYFRVTPDTARPFVVTLKDLSIKVLGTEFNIQHDSSLQRVEVVVTEGKVLFSNQADSIIIQKGWYGQYDELSKTFSLQRIPEQKVNDLAYATHSFEFEESTFSEITLQLGKVYNVDFIFKNENIGQCKVHGAFKDKSLEFILDVIGAALQVQYIRTGNTIVVEGNGCL